MSPAQPGGVTVAPQDVHKRWAQRALELRLPCTCWPCLREAGITPDGGAHAQHRSDKREPASLVVDVVKVEGVAA